MQPIGWLAGALLLAGCTGGPGSDGAEAPCSGAGCDVVEDVDPADAEATTGDDSEDGAHEGPPDPGDVECVENYGKACTEDNAVVWVDSCGDPGVVWELCGDERTCEFGECVDVCLPEAKIACHNDNLFWFDSCGDPISVAEACDDWCVDAMCVTASYDGDWLMTADPPTAQVGSLGIIEYGERIFELTVVGSEVTALLHTSDPPALLTGTRDGKDVTISGQWAEPGPPALLHDLVLNAQFTSADQLFGVEVDEIGSEGTPLGKAVWNVMGARQ